MAAMACCNSSCTLDNSMQCIKCLHLVSARRNAASASRQSRGRVLSLEAGSIPQDGKTGELTSSSCRDSRIRAWQHSGNAGEKGTKRRSRFLLWHCGLRRSAGRCAAATLHGRCETRDTSDAPAYDDRSYKTMFVSGQSDGQLCSREGDQPAGVTKYRDSMDFSSCDSCPTVRS